MMKNEKSLFWRSFTQGTRFLGILVIAGSLLLPACGSGEKAEEQEEEVMEEVQPMEVESDTTAADTTMMAPDTTSMQN